MVNHTCLFCKTCYPDFDKTVDYYSVNVFGKDKIICGDCKKRLRLIENNNQEDSINEERKMFATITFKVKDEEEFEDYKAASQLPDEEWELIG